jgi:hypothetical protein
MDGFLDKSHIPKLNQERVNNLHRNRSDKEIEVIKNLPTKKKKSPEPDGFGTHFYLPFKEDLIRIFLKLFHKIETEGIIICSMKPQLL